jgi:hypothetical protein
LLSAVIDRARCAASVYCFVANSEFISCQSADLGIGISFLCIGDADLVLLGSLFSR